MSVTHTVGSARLPLEREVCAAVDTTARHPAPRRGPPSPRFKEDTTRQLDVALGSPELALPADHLARIMWDLVGTLDTRPLLAKRSWLGRHGFDPRRLLAVWVYGSRIGCHSAAGLARLSKTDLAIRWLTGGHAVSEPVLQKFRAENRRFMEDALQQTVRIAADRGLLDPEAIAIDAARIRADASTKSIRTAKRSAERLEELASVDVDALDADGRSQHDAKVEKHRDAVRRCADSDRTSFSVTDPNAALIKFPSGASQPGHRLSIGASRSDVRFVVTALVDGAPTDFGKLREVTTAVEVALLDAGLLSDDAPTMKLVADAGYTARDDLRFASEVRSRIDILVPIPKSKSAILNGQPQLGVEAFQVDGDTAICPANRTMQGPRHSKDGTVQWLGVGCAECPLKPRCTGAKRRTLAIHPETQALRQAMAERMNADGARKRYNQRIATVEPIFSYISDTMGFTRSSSRRTDTVVAEILLKLLTYNLLRLHTAATDRRYICTHARTS